MRIWISIIWNLSIQIFSAFGWVGEELALPNFWVLLDFHEKTIKSCFWKVESSSSVANRSKFLSNIPGDRASKTEQNQLFRYYISCTGSVLFVQHCPTLVIFKGKKRLILTVHRLPYSHAKDLHADFHVCYVNFSPLQNGKKISEKEASLRGEKRLTLSACRPKLARKERFRTKACLGSLFSSKISISQELESDPI